MLRINLAGLPAHISLSGTLFVTMLPQPITLLRPMVTPLRITLLAPMNAPSHMRTGLHTLCAVSSLDARMTGSSEWKSVVNTAPPPDLYVVFNYNVRVCNQCTLAHTHVVAYCQAASFADNEHTRLTATYPVASEPVVHQKVATNAHFAAHCHSHQRYATCSKAKMFNTIAYERNQCPYMPDYP